MCICMGVLTPVNLLAYTLRGSAAWVESGYTLRTIMCFGTGCDVEV